MISHVTNSVDDKADRRIPITVVTGFLGAGKTTLLNTVLSETSAGKIAVIVNELGEAGLDHDLIETVEDEIVMMQSGCLCCSIRGDLSGTIANLIERRDDGALRFERIVIETTGLADPGPILQALLVDPELAKATRMDGLVTVVDAANGPTTLDAQIEAVSQVAMADLILLSKTDLVSPAVADALSDRLKSLNPSAQIKRPVGGCFKLDILWGLSGLRKDIDPKEAIAWTSAAQPREPDPLGNLSGFSRPKTTQMAMSPHDTRISSASIVLNAPLKDAAFDLWLDTLIALKGPDILRVKGIVFLQGLETPFVFHGVQHIFDPPVPMKNWDGDDRRSRIVVITRDLGRPELQRSLDMLRAHQPDLATKDKVFLTHD
ncbi:CobW family GTP-binding protein [Ruegeria meonggei]|uniref:Putative GTP-binding protein YjiA n=1 Tax=Ruegeria meonggei TaxID=1446476 RepID=A0A1X6ZKA3_9RHOB|nr:GTP-binding protein [Ruegeria meonggei]SLN53251.1 putative GTP-binding protein YjiA [Ruegeria meonggei]